LTAHFHKGQLAQRENFHWGKRNLVLEPKNITFRFICHFMTPTFGVTKIKSTNFSPNLSLLNIGTVECLSLQTVYKTLE